jgi:predicted phage-related endonuclease
MKWGRRLEDVVAQAYQEETGREVTTPIVKTMHHPIHHWIGASLDRVTCDGDGRILECKTSNQSQEWGTPGTDEVPEHYAIQVQHQMYVTGVGVTDIAVLINGSDFRVFTVERNDRLIEKLLLILSDFWNKVQNHVEPAPDWAHPATGNLVRSLWGVDDTLRIELPECVDAEVVRYEALRHQIATLEGERQGIKGKLLWYMAQAGEGSLSNGGSLIRKKIHRAGYTVAPRDYVTLRVRKGNEVLCVE